MKKLTRILSILPFLAVLSFAQVAMVSTTTTAAVSLAASQVQLTSVTGVLATNGVNVVSNILIDREEMDVLSVTGLVAQVRRGVNGTPVTTHASGAKVWVGPPNAFANYEPSGACVSTQQAYAPTVVSASGNVWTCGNGGWTLFSTFSAKLSLGAVLDSTGANSTIAPTNSVHHVSNTGSVQTITVPAACPKICQVILIPDAAFTTVNTGNIALASTGVVSKALIMTWDGGASKWYPSY